MIDNVADIQDIDDVDGIDDVGGVDGVDGVWWFFDVDDIDNDDINAIDDKDIKRTFWRLSIKLSRLSWVNTPVKWAYLTHTETNYKIHTINKQQIINKHTNTG